MTLNSAQRLEIAQRAKAGERQCDIADRMGLPRTTVGWTFRKVRAALDMPTAEQEIAAKAMHAREELIRRVEAGDSNDTIAAALGRSRQAIYHLRAELGLGQLRCLRLTGAEESEAERRLMLGESTRDVAAALGCSQGAISVRRQRLLDRIPTDLLCECGKPQNHSSHCRMAPDKIELLRERLLAGRKVQHLAAEFGYSAQALRSHYARPIIAEMRAKGVPCICGKMFAHNGQCVGTGSTPAVLAARDALKSQVEPLLRQGMRRPDIARHLGVTLERVGAIARPIMRALAAEGVLCPCGQPLDHHRVCSFRFNRTHCGPGGQANHVVYGEIALSISPNLRGRLRKMAIKGRSDPFIAECLSIDPAVVAAAVADQEAVGVKMAPCRCGLPRNHRSMCQNTRPPKIPHRQKGAGLKMTSEQRRRLMELYKAGTSAKQMVRVTGISTGVVGRLVRQWRDGRRNPLRPCPCGRPGRHPGSCSYRVLGGFDQRMLSRSEELMREGYQPREIARKLDVGIVTLLKRTRDLRGALHSEGVHCPCGLIFGHPFWCTATWDERGQPRGRQPIDPALAEAAARALVRGDLVQDVADEVGLPTVRVWEVRKALSLDDRHRRSRVMRERLAMQGSAGGVAIMAEVQAAVPRSIDRMIRDDIVGELVMARMEGRVEAAELKKVVRSFVTKGLAQWSGQYQKSADAAFGADDGRTLAGTLADDTTEGMLEQFFIGGAVEKRLGIPTFAETPALSTADRINLDALGLDAAVDDDAIRRRFGELARRYHPDQNGGDRRHEAELSRITVAYRELRKSLGIREGPS